MGLSPNDAPVVLRDTSIEEIYALDFEREVIASWALTHKP
jgi:hypothetical protein